MFTYGNGGIEIARIRHEDRLREAKRERLANGRHELVEPEYEVELAPAEEHDGLAPRTSLGELIGQHVH